MKSVRQVEAAELMIASNMYSARFAGALVAGTRKEMLVVRGSGRMPSSVSGEQKMRMENETDTLLRNIKAVEQSYGTEVLTLSVSRRYLDALLGNTRVHEYIVQRHPDIGRELASLVATLESEQTHTRLPKLRPTPQNWKPKRIGSRSRKLQTAPHHE